MSSEITNRPCPCSGAVAKRTFMACTEAHESVKALECWQHMLQWSPEPQAEFNCATTTMPEL